MCPHGYHHNGFMATAAVGTQEVRLHMHCSHCEQCAMHSANSERSANGALHPIQESAQTAWAV